MQGIKQCSWLLAGLCCLVVSGCGPETPLTAPVHGRITVGGKPITTGRIVFYPEIGRSGTAVIGADGTYRLATFQPNDGATIGKHHVTIESFHAKNGKAKAASFADEVAGKGSRSSAGNTPSLQWFVPEIYSNRSTSPLNVEVKTGDNTLDFAIP